MDLPSILKVDFRIVLKEMAMYVYTTRFVSTHASIGSGEGHHIVIAMVLVHVCISVNFVYEKMTRNVSVA